MQRYNIKKPLVGSIDELHILKKLEKESGKKYLISSIKISQDNKSLKKRSRTFLI